MYVRRKTYQVEEEGEIYSRSSISVSCNCFSTAGWLQQAEDALVSRRAAHNFSPSNVFSFVSRKYAKGGVKFIVACLSIQELTRVLL